MTFGGKVKAARVGKKMTQSDLAKKVGKTNRTVISWEADRALPRTRSVYQSLADALNVNVGYLINDDSYMIENAGIIIPDAQINEMRRRKSAAGLADDLAGLFRGGSVDNKEMASIISNLVTASMEAKTARRNGAVRISVCTSGPSETAKKKKAGR